jgi:hypothetical protein
VRKRGERSGQGGRTYSSELIWGYRIESRRGSMLVNVCGILDDGMTAYRCGMPGHEGLMHMFHVT